MASPTSLTSSTKSSSSSQGTVSFPLLRRSPRSHVRGNVVLTVEPLVSRLEVEPYLAQLLSPVAPPKPREAFAALVHSVLMRENTLGRIRPAPPEPIELLSACEQAWCIPRSGAWRVAVELEAGVSVWCARKRDTSQGHSGRTVTATHVARTLLPLAGAVLRRVDALPASGGSETGLAELDLPTLRTLRRNFLTARNHAISLLVELQKRVEVAALSETHGRSSLIDEFEALWEILLQVRDANVVDDGDVGVIVGHSIGIDWNNGWEKAAEGIGRVASSSLISSLIPFSISTTSISLSSLTSIIASLTPAIRSLSLSVADLSDRPHLLPGASCALAYARTATAHLIASLGILFVQSTSSLATSPGPPDASAPLALHRALKSIAKHLTRDNTLQQSAKELLTFEAQLGPLVARWLVERCGLAEEWADRACAVSSEPTNGIRSNRNGLDVGDAVVDVFTVVEAVVDVVAKAGWSNSVAIRQWTMMLARLTSLATSRLSYHLWRKFAGLAASVSPDAATEAAFHEALVVGPNESGSGSNEKLSVIGNPKASRDGRQRSVSPVSEVAAAALGIFRRGPPKSPSPSPSPPQSPDLGRGEGSEEERRRYDARFGRIKVHRKGKSEWGRTKTVKGPYAPAQVAYSVPGAEETAAVVCWGPEIAWALNDLHSTRKTLDRVLGNIQSIPDNAGPFTPDTDSDTSQHQHRSKLILPIPPNHTLLTFDLITLQNRPLTRTPSCPLVVTLHSPRDGFLARSTPTGRLGADVHMRSGEWINWPNGTDAERSYVELRDQLERRITISGGVRCSCVVRSVRSADGRWPGGKVCDGEKAVTGGPFEIALGGPGGPILLGRMDETVVGTDGEGWERVVEWWKAKTAKAVDVWIDACEATVVNEVGGCFDLGLRLATTRNRERSPS
ncbi:hypothetical protein M427DRAFT_168080 [Gonapodya prolifera JEL478]|uniref:MHD1 domain-containing protein n=1 Tax=Gonapodya prolifera (strain JEL478) TaxID=1344416 RepID=A0A139AZT3_GONPJ|nr:hypothetical protein M427DRAFT_168080 [Gonapodya prolifera JEL478]|eukprot:KXS22252.1 hypothetical protein M427DRAFT_168080 [Gonapodya prolifera JEL478]